MALTLTLYYYYTDLTFDLIHVLEQKYFAYLFFFFNFYHKMLLQVVEKS